MKNADPVQKHNHGFESFYDYAPIAYLTLDEEKIIREINLTTAEILGIEKSKAVGKNFISFVAERDKEKFNEKFLRSIEKNERLAAEYFIKAIQGEISAHMILIPYSEAGEELSIKIFFSDNTTRKKTEQINDEIEKRFRLMADNSPVMIWMTDAANKLVYMNKTKLDFLGIKGEELTYESWLDTRHPEERERFVKELFDAARDKRPFSIEVRIKAADGKYHWLIDSASPRFLEDGTFAGFIGSGIDITERKKAEKVIKDSEKRFRAMADNSPVMIWMTDENNQLEYMNKTKLDFLGQKKDDLTFNSWIESRHPDDREKFLKILSNSAKEKKGFSVEIRVKDAEGNYRWLLDSAAPKFSEDGSFAGFIGSGVDITERRVAEKVIKDSEERFRRMADSSPVMIWMTDSQNNLEYMNKTKLQFLGKGKNEMTYQTWLDSRHPDDRDAFLKALVNAALNKKPFSIEVRVKNADGDYRWLLDSAAPRFSDDGTFAGFIGSGIDITEEKAFRAYLQKSLKEKEVLLMEIHHRVKNNLQIITSLLSLQSSRVKDEDTLEIFRTSQDRVRSMALLHEKLYKSEDIHRINIREYFDDLISYLLTSYNQLDKVKVNLNIIDIQIDINLSITLGLIINELISNSIKHAFKGKSSGEIYVELSRTNKMDELQLVVSDNGIGMPKDFDVENSDTLGLELVRTLVTQHDGKFKILQNDLTKFVITLQYGHESVSNQSF